MAEGATKRIPGGTCDTDVDETKHELCLSKILTMPELSPNQTTCMGLFKAENRRIYFLRNRCFVPASIEGDDTRHLAFSVRKDFIVGRWPQGPDGIMTFFNLHAILLC